MMGYRIVTNGTFQHHGILGQKWGVITKNVGVNYIPIGGRGSSSDSTASRVLKGAASGAKAAGQAVTGAGKAIARGAKAVKADHDARVAKKQASAYRSDKRLTKKQIAGMTDAEVQAAINRRQKEQQLYDMEHPQIKAGKEFFSRYVADTLMSLGGDYAKALVKMKVDDSVRNFIKNNSRYSEEQKRDLLNRLNVEQLGDKLSREAFESRVRTKNDRENKLNNIQGDMEYSRRQEEATRKAINSLYDNENDRIDARIRNGVASTEDKLNKSLRDSASISKKIDDMGLDPLRSYSLKKQYNVNTPKDDMEYEIMKNVTSAKNVDNVYSALRKELGSDTADRIMKTAKYSAIVKNNNGKNNSNPYDFTEEELEKLRNIIHDYI